MPRRGSNLVFGLLVGLAVVLTVVAGLVLSGQIVSDPGHADETALPPPPAAKQRPARTQTQAATTTAATPVVQAASVRIAATRGDCWVVAHAGSADGPVLLERTLRSGEQATVSARRVFLELGAAGNVDVMLNGKPRPIPSGTTDLVLG
jgi:hypothetical protein